MLAAFALLDDTVGVLQVQGFFRGDLSGMGQQAIVYQAAFDQMTEQKLRQRSRLKACAGTIYFAR
jgi:hypothetical protein